MKKIEPPAPETRSADVVAANLAKLRDLFPEVFSDGSVNFEVLCSLLGDPPSGQEVKFGLHWHGKGRARQIALTPSTATLRPKPSESLDWASTKNLIIEGDNLEVLKLLQRSYAGAVSVIYIDPPYNLGKDVVYQDDFADAIGNYLRLTGQVDDNGARLTTNTEASGRFHTNWLNMVFPRLLVARELLRPDGVLFISIDDREVSNLRLLCDAVLGEENFIALLPTIMNLKGNNDEFGFAGTHEYTLAYARQRSACRLNEWPLDEEEVDEWTEDERGPFKRGANLKATGGNAPKARRPNLYYPIYVSKDFSSLAVERRARTDIEVLPITDGKPMSWRWSRQRVAESTHDIIITEDGGSITLYKKQRPALGDLPSKKPKSVLYKPEYSSGNGTAELAALLGARAFVSPPKPLRLIQDLILIGSDKGALVLDFFAGSGTTGHAVMRLNAADGGQRRFILVQLPEPLDPANPDQKIAADFCDSIKKPRTIAELTKERLRRAAADVKGKYPLLVVDTGFRVFTLAESNIRTWSPVADALPETLADAVEHVREGRTPADILYEVLLKCGLDLAVPIEDRKIAGHKVHSVGAGTLMVCLAPKIARGSVEPLAEGIVAWHKEQSPGGESEVIFRDSAFENDVAKTNLTEILKQGGLTRVRSL